jgi:hypothetical protein
MIVGCVAENRARSGSPFARKSLAAEADRSEMPIECLPIGA